MTAAGQERVAIDARNGRYLAMSVSGNGRLPFVWGHALQASMHVDEASGVFDWSGLGAVARVIRYDARAHGGSCGERDPAGCEWQALARDMWCVADHAGARRAVLGGASMGCATALWAAVQQPRRTRGLVLVIPPTAWELRPRQVRAYLLMARMVRLGGRLPFRLANLLLGERPAPTPLRAIAREVVRGIASRDPRDVETAFRGAALSDLPAPERLAALQVPALILAWPDDPSHPVEIARRLADILPRARLHVAQDAGEVGRWPGRIRRFLRAID